ncbi:gamma-secretase subunit Aph-1-like isoform X2 [Tachypleus tridentatus]|uniref:gamma-secretase subunit Aph-1-like isoform X2 n=1 Tax=Tachypleus tridentatus TaxID=6853 RepID=UPI003FD3942D
MTVMEFFGCAFIAFGPPLAMFALTVANDPIRIIILISAAFFWLLSLLLSSILWYVVVPLRKTLAFGLVFSVIFQEMFRFSFYKLLRKAEVGLKKVTEVGADRHAVTTGRNTLAYAFTTLAFTLLHTFWGVIFFHAWDHQHYFSVIYVICSHLVVSCLTLINQHGMYAASLVPVYCITIVTGILAFKAAGGSWHSFRAFIRITPK